MKVRRRRQAGRLGGGARVAISHFSRRSRRQLLLNLNSIDRVSAPGLLWAFVTLTYHREDVTPRECKRHLKNLRAALRRACPTLAFIWKMEPQKRGTPHLHLLAYLPFGLDHDTARDAIAKHWHLIADPESEAHLRMMEFRGWTKRAKRREFFQPMNAWSQVSGYAAKYCGKPIEGNDAWGNPGRFWGVHNARGLPRTIVRARVSEAAAVWVGRQIRRYLEHLPTGRIDSILNGKRETFSREAIRRPGFIEGQEMLARFSKLNGGDAYEIKRYHYRPATNVRNRVGFVPAAVVDRLVTHADSLHPLAEPERREVAELEAKQICERPTADAAAAVRLRSAIRRVAAAMFLRARESEWFDQHRPAPPPPRPHVQLGLWAGGEKS